MYCAFVDLKRAFDSVYRLGLWYNMVNSGIDGKLFQLIRSVYLDVSRVSKVEFIFRIFQIRYRLVTR